jgi:hypothetical protein
MFGGSLADPFAVQPATYATRTSQLGQKNASGQKAARAPPWVPSRPADPMRPFLVLSALAALNGLDPSAQVRLSD